jgi:hypothetical protein
LGIRAIRLSSFFTGGEVATTAPVTIMSDICIAKVSRFQKPATHAFIRLLCPSALSKIKGVSVKISTSTATMRVRINANTIELGVHLLKNTMNFSVKERFSEGLFVASKVYSSFNPVITSLSYPAAAPR